MPAPSLPKIHRVEMSRWPSWFTTPFEVEIVKDTAAGRSVAHVLPSGPVTFSLAPMGIPGQLLCAAPPTFQTTMADVAWASMRFHRLLNPASGYQYWDTRAYLDGYVMLARAFGQAFTLHQADGWLLHSVGVERIGYLHHGESLRSIQERFAYGLALLFAGDVLGIPIERFFFRRGGEARPDFATRVTAADLRKKASYTGALAPGGEVVNIEVRGRSQSGNSFDPTPAALYKLHQKALATPKQAVWFIKSHMPGSVAPRTRGRLVVIDPNEPVPLSKDEQLRLILHEIVMVAIRHGLMATASRALAWLKDIMGKLPADARVANSVIDPFGQTQLDSEDERRQRSADGAFTGWIFSDLILRFLGRGRRQGDLSRDEVALASWFLSRQDPGLLWFSGVRRDVLDAVEQRDGDFLRSVGVDSPWLSQRGDTVGGRSEETDLEVGRATGRSTAWQKRWTTFEDRSEDPLARNLVLGQLERAVQRST